MVERLDSLPIPVSPILAINREVQLKNHVASVSQQADRSTADPWDDMNVLRQHYNHNIPTTDCPQCHDTAITSFCTVCGKTSRKRNRPNSMLATDPNHVDALLDVTPHLRFISVASTDMQGAASQNGNNNNLLTIIANAVDGDTNDNGGRDDFTNSLRRDQANRQAAAELSSLLWVLAHEMSIEDYGKLETEVFSQVFALIHSKHKELKVAGLTALDALLTVPSADDERKGIQFANALSNALRSAQGDFEALRLCTQSLGRMAARTTSVDFVESEITRALEWLRMDRSDRRYAHVLLLQTKETILVDEGVVTSRCIHPLS